MLPARKEAVENDFLKEMRDAARLAIYRAMAASPDPRPAFDDWKRARQAGIDIAPPPAVLRPWRPATAHVDDWREPPKLAVPGHGALVMDVDPEPPEAQAFGRAAERAGMATSLFETDRRLAGYDWYDGLDRVAGIATHVAIGGKEYPLEDFPLPERTGPAAAVLPSRPETIRPDGPRRPAGARAGPHVRPAGRSRRSPASHGAGSATPSRWSPPRAGCNRTSSRNCFGPGSFRPATMPTPTATRPSATASTRKPSTWRPA